jgi:hypothetical protein
MLYVSGYWGKLTWISTNAFSSFPTLRATIITFAPFWDSCIATAFPIPSEPPVRRTVCQLVLAPELEEAGI